MGLERPTKENIVQILSFINRLRLFYRTYLSRYGVFRLAKQIILRIYFCSPLFFTKLRLVLVTSKRSFVMMPMAQFLDNEQIPGRLVKDRLITEVPGPRFANTCPIELDTQDIVSVVEPEIKVVEIPSVIAMGGTNLLLREDIAIYPDLQQPTRDVIPAEYLGVATVDTETSNITVRLDRKRRRINRGISLLGNCNGNYAHWLVETLPKLVIIDEIDEYRDFPLIVDKWVHPNILSSIDSYNRHNREIIGVNRWETIEIDQLIDVSPPSYTPPEYRVQYERHVLQNPCSDYYLFSGFALDKTRQFLNNSPKLSTKTGKSKYIYIKRYRNAVGNGRLLINADDVDCMMSEYKDFLAVEPSEINFDEQVSLFREAEVIVGPIGAALVNALFAPAGCRIVAISPFYEKADYYYFSNLMGILGHDIEYVLGPQVFKKGPSRRFIDVDYQVNLSDLRDAIDRVL